MVYIKCRESLPQRWQQEGAQSVSRPRWKISSKLVYQCEEENLATNKKKVKKSK